MTTLKVKLGYQPRLLPPARSCPSPSGPAPHGPLPAALPLVRGPALSTLSPGALKTQASTQSPLA